MKVIPKRTGLTEEEIEKQIKMLDNIKSNMEAPLFGYIKTPICKICKNADYSNIRYPKCVAFGDMPKEYRHCKSYDCESLNFDKNSKFKRFFIIED